VFYKVLHMDSGCYIKI